MCLAPTYHGMYVIYVCIYIFIYICCFVSSDQCGSLYDMLSCAVFIVYKSVLYQLVNKLFFNKRTFIGHCLLLLRQMTINAPIKSYSIKNNYYIYIQYIYNIRDT